jgi:hypothetical protein
MSENSVEAALNRAAQEQKDQNQRDISDARATLSHLEMKDMNTIGPPPAPMGAPNPKGLDEMQINPAIAATYLFQNRHLPCYPGCKYLTRM